MSDSSNRKRPRASVDTAFPPSTSPRSVKEWVSIAQQSVLLLPPTQTMVERATITLGTTRKVKIAAFDMDDTIIKPRTGKVFAAPGDATDWTWVHERVPEVLRLLHSNNFLIVLFSNQQGITRGSKWDETLANTVREKIVALSGELQVPLSAMCATRKDRWRKPCPDMWEQLLADMISEACGNPLRETVDMRSCSFHCGDAAGRPGPTLAGRKKDFSCSDRKFAWNIGVAFLTPEQLFLPPTKDLLSGEGEGAIMSTKLWPTVPPPTAAPFSWDGVNPEELRAIPPSYAGTCLEIIDQKGVHQTQGTASFARPGTQEMIIFVGFPGCGKSTFFKTQLEPHGYLRVNRDTLKTKQRCLAVAEEEWGQGRSLVIDNTNPSVEDRLQYIELVRRTHKSGPLPVRIFFFMHSKALAMHMNEWRAAMEGGAAVPEIAYHVFGSRLQRSPWTPAEVEALGVDSVVKIPPVVDVESLSKEAKKLFFQLH